MMMMMMMMKHNAILLQQLLLVFVLLSPTCYGWTIIPTSTRIRIKRTNHPHHHQTTTTISSSRLLVLLHASILPTSSKSNNNSQSSNNINKNSKNRDIGFVSFGQWLLERALDSPLWEYVLIPQARQKMMQTAQANGIDWNECKSWLANQDGLWNKDDKNNDLFHSTLDMIPEYYKNTPYHAYIPHGNLCWEAALEVEIASKAVGARNFPAFGVNGENAFRNAFGVALDEITGIPSSSTSSTSSSIRAVSATTLTIQDKKKKKNQDDEKNDNDKEKKDDEFIIVDFGCGTGMSTRWLARRYPQATKILGIDLSPYFIHVGQRLLELTPRQRQRQNNDHHDHHDHHDMQQQQEQQGTWVSTIDRDDRIEYIWGNAASTGLPDNYCHVVNLQFVAHELPISATCDIFREAQRILKSNGKGQLWFCEMDFDSPGYAAQRANPLLFSLIRATEPYLDEYANHAIEIRQCLQETFDDIVITAATGRHFAICATKITKNNPQQQPTAVAASQQEEEEHDDDNDTSCSNQKTTTTRRMGTLRDLRFDEHGVYRMEDTHLKVWENKGGGGS